jgi:hypothetical protein
MPERLGMAVIPGRVDHDNDGGDQTAGIQGQRSPIGTSPRAGIETPAPDIETAKQSQPDGNCKHPEQEYGNQSGGTWPETREQEKSGHQFPPREDDAEDLVHLRG